MLSGKGNLSHKHDVLLFVSNRNWREWERIKTVDLSETEVLKREHHSRLLINIRDY